VTKLAGAFAAHASVVISYTRGEDTTADLNATIGRTPFEVVEGEVMSVFESRDFILSAASLIVGGSVVLPQAGDVITEAGGTQYMVSAPKPFNCYERFGPAGSVLKIHTKGPF